jgi:L-fuconolactonase
MTRHLIDAHLHVWERARHAQPWIDPQAMAVINHDYPPAGAAAELAANGVAGCVAIQCINEFTETVDLLADASEIDAIRGVVGWVDLTADVEAQVETLRNGVGGDLLVGVRHVTFEEPDPAWLARDDVGRGLAALAKSGLTYDLLVGPHQLRIAAEVVNQNPATSFILDHLGKVPLTSTSLVTWARDLAELAKCPNLVMKVSGVITEDDPQIWSVERLRPVIEHALATFGAQRLLFGSDWPVVELAATYQRWLEAYLRLTEALSPSERAAIDGANTMRTYGLT